MSNPPFFSIIVPVYKVEKFLEQCVQSVLTQTYKDFELILVDDGSPDECPRMCDEYATNDCRVKVIHKKNGGLSDARNKGLSAATGVYILFLDSDDFWLDNKALEKIKNRLDEINVDVLIFGMQKYYQKDNSFSAARVPSCDKVFESQTQVTKQMMEQNIFVACAWDKVVRHSYIRKNDMSFVKGQLSEDIEWCCRLLLGNPSMGILGEAFYVYRQQNENSITANIGRKNLEHICSVIEKYSKEAVKTGNDELLNFLSVQYVQWMTVSNLVDKKKIRDLLVSMKKQWYLINYHWNKRVLIVHRFHFLGFAVVRILLGAYKKIKLLIKM